MKVHHLNCGTMRPPLVPPIVCHVLLIETANGLALVDTGFGLADIASQARRIGVSRHLLRPVFRPEETAAHHVERLGFRREDVRDIVVTHFDLDHIGGIADFPQARIHVTAVEANAAMWSPSWRERMRYRSAQWDHRPIVVEHEPAGEMWRGFAAAKELYDIAPGIVLINLPGHSRGHAAVAVDAGHRWVMHCGDAFFHRGTLDHSTPVPAMLKTFTTLTAFNLGQMRANEERLAELADRHDDDLQIVCSHDPVMLERAIKSSPAGGAR